MLTLLHEQRMKSVGEEDLALTSTDTIQTAPNSDHELELGSGEGKGRRDPLSAFCRRFRRRMGGNAET
jgi:hypothetical protein